jgi:uncharacterized membrane protein
MTLLIAGLVIFLGIHSISIVAPSLREQMLTKLGEGPWKGLYSLISIIGLVLIVYGYGAARLEPTVLYVPPSWLRHFAFVLLLLVFPLVLATHFPGRIKAKLKHPMIIGVKLWALAHLLANGNLADVLLFGAILAWAVADLISVKRRAARPVPGFPPSGWNDAIAVVGGLGVYVAFVLWLHPMLIGMALLG